MKKYFYLENKEQLGPFTIEELKQKGIRNDTMVWYKGMAEWQRADSLSELNDLFDLPPAIPVPPPAKQQEEVEKPAQVHKTEKSKTINLFGNEVKTPVFFALAVILLIIIVAAIWLIAANTGNSASEEVTDSTEAVIDSSAYYSGEDPEGEGVNADDEFNQDRMAEEQAIKNIIANYRKYYKVGVKYDTKTLGGLKNVIVTLKNDTPFDVKSATVMVEYFSKKDKSVEKVYVAFTDVAGGSTVSKIIEDSKKGKKAKAYVIKIYVPEIGFEK